MRGSCRIIIPSVPVLCVDDREEKTARSSERCCSLQTSQPAHRRSLSQLDSPRERTAMLTDEKVISSSHGVKCYIFYHGKRHPKELDAEHVRSFLTHLAVNENVSASTQNQAFNALLFLYRQVLKTEPLNIEGVERARHSRRLPVVFTKAEATAIIAQMKDEHQLIAGLLYGAGVRIMEAVRLRIKDVDFGRNEIIVRDGKGEQ